ncbi:hypothetical protein D9615_008388 [Tricholomella constricta]|uniref:ELYS-like domain-containing protein n=1 Tax=Tricholomella constricta TaxID=117010 RepID=A0A8H5HDJ1_9AGAR|nr:hypothetical protein D9615_008388 [Tricholomella constricta]
MNSTYATPYENQRSWGRRWRAWRFHQRPRGSKATLSPPDSYFKMDEELSPYLRYFDVSATGFAWQEPRPDQIVRRRADMDDKFIFDILLVSGGIEKPDTLFPPRNVEDLRALLLAIWDSAYDILKKECLVYYLLKWHLDGREERLQIDRCIPPQFTALADAYWHLDAGVNIPRAVSILSDNRLNREYASKILHAISISSNPSPLVVQYVRTAKPLLTAPQDVWTYTLALADSSLLEAWQFQRTFNETEELRTQLLEKILDWCISPSPRTTALTAFLSLPLSSFEEQFLHKYALEPPKSLSRPSIAILRDLICVRLIQSGKYAEAIKADHQFAASTLNESKTHSQDRRKMVQDLYAALPLAERMLLDSELELELITNGGQQKPKPTPTPTLTINGMPSRSTTTNNKENKNNKTGAADASMSLSLSQTWEKIPRPTSSQPLTNGHAHGLAPRFGGPHLGASTSAVAAAPTTAPPLIPVSTPGTATANGISTSQGFPLSLSLSLSQSQPQSQTSTRKSFGTAQHAPFFPGGASSKGSSSSSSRPLQRQPQFDFNASTSTMTSASRKANAFYKPPVQSQPQNAGGGGGSGVKRPFEDLAGSAAGTGTGKGKGGRMEVDMDGDEEMDLDFDVEHERVAKKEKKPQEDEDDDDDEDEMEDEGHREREQEQEQEQGLGFSVSVFGNGPPPRAAHHTQTQTQTQTKTKPAPAPARTSRGSKTSAPAPAVARTSRRVPPGAFASDDDEEEDEGEEEEPPAPTTTTTARSTRTRTSARHTRTSTAAAAAAAEPQSRRRAREVERDRDRDLGRSLPGSLMDEDEDEQEEDGEEAADYVAPLREEASPPVRRGVRRVRSTTPGSDMGDEDGAAQTRRRSSRLSTAGVSPPPPPPPSKKASSAGTGAGVTKARKSRAVGGAVKKKR